MIKRLLQLIPIVALFFVAALIVLAARAPRTWAVHWNSPRTLSVPAGEYDYGAVPAGSGGWDLLWVDDTAQRMVYTAEATGTSPHSVKVDSGDVSQPSLSRSGAGEVGVWVRSENGRSVLMEATFSRGAPRIRPLLTSAAPLEHPYAFSGQGGKAMVVFSWQRDGNYALFLAPLPAAGSTFIPRKLASAQYYSFFPRAVEDARGVIHLLHLESCCSQKTWRVLYDRFDSSGHRLGSPRVLTTIESLPNSTPAEWPEDLTLDSSGHIWGAYAGDAGMYLFEAASDGTFLRAPAQIDTESGRPDTLSLALNRTEGYVTWGQGYDLGTYVDARRFSVARGALSGTERVVYDAGSQSHPHVFAAAGGATILWEASQNGQTPSFQAVDYRPTGSPTLAQRIGLGLGNPWEEVAVLTLGALGFATVTTTVNILWILGLTVVGILTIRLLRWLPSRWVVYSCVLACLLFLLFVTPGAPILFLDTMPAVGLAILPFGGLAFGAVLAFVTFVGAVPLRRVDDAYRAGLMAFFGVYFFAFVEAVVFIQQRLGYI